MSREILIFLRSPVALVNASYAFLLVVLAVLPRSIAGSGFGVSDLAAHAVAYGVQGYLLMWVMRPVFSVRRAVFLAVIGTTAFGLFTEVIQSILPYRDFGVADLGADCLGAVAGVGLAFAFGVGRRTVVRQH